MNLDSILKLWVPIIFGAGMSLGYAFITMRHNDFDMGIFVIIYLCAYNFIKLNIIEYIMEANHD